MRSVPVACCGSDEPHVAHSIWRPHMYYCAGNINVVEALVEGEPVMEANQPEPLLREALAKALSVQCECNEYSGHMSEADVLLDVLRKDRNLATRLYRLFEDPEVSVWTIWTSLVGMGK